MNIYRTLIQSSTMLTRILNFVVVAAVVFQDRVYVDLAGWPGTHEVDQATLKLTETCLPLYLKRPVPPRLAQR